MLRKLWPTWVDWLWLIVWLSVIYFFSSLPDPKVPGTDILFLRKGMHMAEYLLLFISWLRALRHSFAWHWQAIVRLALLATVAYAISDEIHQHYVGRDGNVVDVVIDAALPILIWFRTEVQRRRALSHPSPRSLLELDQE